MKFSFSQDAKRSITFSLDACYIGLYFWLGRFCLRIGGVDVTKSSSPHFYPYLVPTFIGFGFVLPNYIVWHTPFDKFKKITDANQATKIDIKKDFKDITA